MQRSEQYVSVCKLAVLYCIGAMQDHISMWFPLHLHENIHEEDIMHLKRMERKYNFDLLKGLEEVFYRQKVLKFSLR